MLTVDHARNRQDLRQKLEQADHQVMRVLLADAGEFVSPAQMRDTLNRARDTRRWAHEQLAKLESAGAH